MFRTLLMVFIYLSLTAVVSAAPRVLVVLSNVSLIPGTMEKTGVWAEELVVPYELFKKAGFEVTLASPKGGEALFDEKSLDPRMVPDKSVRQATLRFKVRYAHLMRNTLHLAEVNGDDFDAIFVPGGHGVMFDVATDPTLAKLTVQFLRQGKIVGSVCHGPCFLAKARDKRGRFAVSGYEVTGFSNEEEEGVKMVEKMPFSLEDELIKASGGLYSKGPSWQCYVVKSRNLVTGQNPASSEKAAHEVIKLLVSPGREAWLESFVEDRFQTSKRRPLKSLQDNRLPSGVVIDVIRRGCTWDTGLALVSFKRRKADFPRQRFLKRIHNDVKRRLKAFENKGLKGYVVLATRDFEMAYLNWRNRASFNRAMASPKGKSLMKSTQAFTNTILWKEARKYPTWLQR